MGAGVESLQQALVYEIDQGEEGLLCWHRDQEHCSKIRSASRVYRRVFPEDSMCVHQVSKILI